MSDLVRSALIAIPKHQYESSEALGMSRVQTYWYIIIPQTVRRLIPLSINLITRMIKTTSLVLMIGVVGPSGCGKSTLLRCLNGLEPAHPPLLPLPALLHPAVPQLRAVTCSARWTRSRRTAP